MGQKKYSGDIKRVFWDIETSPNLAMVWRAGWRISVPPSAIIRERAIICICWKVEGEKEIHHLTWNRGDDKKMLERFHDVIMYSDELVAHNGDNFDIKYFNTRNVFHDLNPIPSYVRTVDTYKIAKKHFLFNSNSLDYLGKFLENKSKMRTDLGMWRSILLDNDPTAMDKMVRYCKRDVVLLEKVWRKLAAYEPDATHAAVAQTGNRRDRWMCPRCGSDHVHQQTRRPTAAGMVRWKMQCQKCGRYYLIPETVHNWFLEDGRGRR